MVEDSSVSNQINFEHVINRFIQPLETRGVLGSEGARKQRLFLAGFYRELVAERNAKALETVSSEVLEAEKMVSRLFPYVTFRVFSTDGRISGPVVFGLPPGFGGMFKISAADIPDLRFDHKGNPFFLKNSYFLQLLDHYFQNSDRPMAEVFDSHMGCAARKLSEQALRKSPEDGGLYADVMRKKAIVTASQNYVNERYSDRDYFPMQFTFDPHNGYGYMGLETNRALQKAKKTGFTANTLNELTEQDMIISTQKVARELSNHFKKQAFDIDWAGNYPDNMLHFWNAIQHLTAESEITTPIRSKIKKIYPEIEEKHLQQRMLLVLSNAFNGFLQNYQKAYPYKDHKETCGVVEERSNGPFKKIGAFLLHPKSEKLPRDIQLIRDIVLDNRKTERIVDFTGTYSTPDDFMNAPIPFVVKGIVRENLSEDHWKILHRLTQTWGEIAEGWFNLEDEEFKTWLNAKTQGEIALPIYEAIIDLFRFMKKLYHTNEIYNLTSHGQIAILPVIVDAKREIKAVIELSLV